jgi:hypothetical protein
MKLEKLSYEEVISTGFTHRAQITFADYTASTTSIRLFPTGAGTVPNANFQLDGRAAIRIITAFDSATNTMSFGTNGTTTFCFTTVDLKSAAGTWLTSAATTNVLGIAASGYAVATLVWTTSAPTVGELYLYFRIIDMNLVAFPAS